MSPTPSASSTAGQLLLVRHGQTPLNADGRLRGHLDPDLDAVGLAEVTALARALAPMRLVRILSSPLRRAMATAEAIAEHHANVMVGQDSHPPSGADGVVMNLGAEYKMAFRLSALAFLLWFVVLMIARIQSEEAAHLDWAQSRLRPSAAARLIEALVVSATESVIWLSTRGDAGRMARALRGDRRCADSSTP